MKIWVIGRGYPTPDNRMWGTFELEQAKLLARQGNEVSYLALTLSFFDRKDPRGLRAFEDSGVKVFAYSHFYFPGKAGIYLEPFEDTCWRRLFRLAEETDGLPDRIHVHYPAMISSIHEIESLRRRGVRLFVTEHWSRVLVNKLRKHEQRRLQYYASHADCFAAVSEGLLEAVKQHAELSVPTEVVPNIVSPVFFETKAEEEPGTFTFLTVGRLVPVKQFDRVIEQFLRTFPEDGNVRLKLIGSGPERKKLETVGGGDKRISFLGEVSLREVAEAMARANALVSFSRYETFAVPVAEAWACGKPAIVSDRSGVAAYTGEDEGLVVSPSAPEELGAAMRQLYENREKYRPEKLSDYASRNFSDSAVIDRLNAMYAAYGSEEKENAGNA